MATFSRTASNLVGSPGSPSTIAASASATGTLAIGTSNNNAEGMLLVSVTLSSSLPAASPTVQFSQSVDGTNYLNDQGPYVVPLAQGTYSYNYVAPKESQGAQVVITNGGTNSITAWVQGGLLAVT